MSKQSIKRRDFIKSTALAGLSAPLIGREALGEAVFPEQQVRQGAAPAMARPVVIASANGARTPTAGISPGGVNCVTRAMEILKAGGDTLDAVVAGGRGAAIRRPDDPRPRPGEGRQHLARVHVGRAIVHHDDLGRRPGLDEDALERLLDRPAQVVAGNDNGDLGAGHIRQLRRPASPSRIP